MKTGDLAGRCNHEMVDLEMVEEDEDRELLRDLLIQHAGYTHSAGRSSLAERLGKRPGPLPKGHAARLSASPARRAASGPPPLAFRNRRRAGRAPLTDQVGRIAIAPPIFRNSSSRPWGIAVGKPTGFMELKRETPKRRPVPERLHDYREVYEPLPRREARRARRALHGLRHPVLPPGLPFGEPDSRLERPRFPGSLARGNRPPPRHEQLPRVHRHALPGPLRGVLRPGHQRRSRSRSSRSSWRSSTAPGTRAGSSPSRRPVRTGKRDCRRRLRPRRFGRRAAVGESRPRGHRLRASLEGWRSAPVRHPRLQDGKMAARPPDRPDAGGRRDLPTQHEHRPRPVRRSSARGVRRHLPVRRSHEARTTCPSRAEISTASTSRWTFCRCKTRRTRERPWRTDASSRPRAGTSSSSAAATPAPTAWAPSTARAAPASISSRSSRAPPRTAPRTTPGRSGGTPSRSRPRTRRAASANTPSARADSSARAEKSPRWKPFMWKPKHIGGRLQFEPIAGTERTYPADLVLLAMGFGGSERAGDARTTRGRDGPSRQRRHRPDPPNERQQGLRRRRHGPRPEPDRLGDRRGKAGRPLDRRVPDGSLQPARAPSNTATTAARSPNFPASGGRQPPVFMSQSGIRQGAYAPRSPGVEPPFP